MWIKLESIDTFVYYINDDVNVITDLHKSVPISINCNDSLHSRLIMMGHCQSNIYRRRNCENKTCNGLNILTTVFEKVQREILLIYLLCFIIDDILFHKYFSLKVKRHQSKNRNKNAVFTYLLITFKTCQLTYWHRYQCEEMILTNIFSAIKSPYVDFPRRPNWI